MGKLRQEFDGQASRVTLQPAKQNRLYKLCVAKERFDAALHRVEEVKSRKHHREHVRMGTYDIKFPAQFIGLQRKPTTGF